MNDSLHTPPVPPVGYSGAYEAAVQEPIKQPSGWGKLFGSFGFGVLSFVASVFAGLVIAFASYGSSVEENFGMACYEIISALPCIIGVLVLGGRTLMGVHPRPLGLAGRAVAVLFIVDAALIVFEIAYNIALGEELALTDNWLISILVVAFLCMGVGLYEEFLLRGLCLNGLLARFGKTTRSTIVCITLSSLIFGLMHLDIAVPVSDTIELAQNILKVVQSGMFGFLMAALVVTSRNVWIPVLLHCAHDFLLMSLTALFTNDPITTEYVSTGDEGIFNIVLYIAICVLYIPMIVYSVRAMLASGMPWRGAFYKERAQTVPIAFYGPDYAQIGQEKRRNCSNAI